MRGIYVDADDDIEATVRKHAVRIARYLFPYTYLSAASAILLGPTRDGNLYLSGHRNQRGPQMIILLDNSTCAISFRIRVYRRSSAPKNLW